MTKLLFLLCLLCPLAVAQDAKQLLAATNAATATEATQLESLRYTLSAAGFQCVAKDTAAARQECFDASIWDYQLGQLAVLAATRQALIIAGAAYYGVPATLADVMAAAQAAKDARIMWPEVMPVLDWSTP